MRSLSKVFDRNLRINNDHILEALQEKEKQIRDVLIENSKPGSLVYVMKTKEFFVNEFQNLSSSRLKYLII
jgi:hypothetical protein